jgi:hypothetical protein
MAIVVVMAALVGAGVWGPFCWRGTWPRRSGRPRRGHGIAVIRSRASAADRPAPAGPLRCLTPAAGSGTIRRPRPPGRRRAGRPIMGQPSDGSAARARWRGYLLTAAVLLAFMLGGTLPVPL